MRQIKNYLHNPPKTLTVKHLTRHKVWDAIIVNQEKVESKHYNRIGVKEKLLEAFNHRCGYCERRISTYAPIEHFRPKHENGYYWLGANWSNLLVACSDCNGYKGEHFDIIGTRAHLPSYKDWEELSERTHISSDLLSQELPLLLHPVLDNPQEHLSFESDGTIKHLSNKGAYTIHLCKLNDMKKRKELIRARQEIIESYRDRVRDLAKLLNAMEVKDMLLHLLIDITNAIREKYPYSAVHRACFERFNEFFIATLPNLNEQQRLHTIYIQLIDQQ
jgi:uncharacterized protein (TIGR02646 family)